ncbi:DedA family protein [Patescibacteria group bacterium]|nr:DedA family protein [Patescibacteria group bacterium]
MSELSIEQLIIALGYVGIFGAMIANGAIAFPSSQILYIVSGFFVFTGDLNLALVVVVGAIGNTIGNVILYELARRRGIHYITRFKIFRAQEIEKVQIAFNRHGALFVFIGKLLPAIKIFIPIVAGLGKLTRVLYVLIILVSSLIWSLIFVGIGFFFGKNADVFGVYGVVLFFVALLLVFGFYKYMNSDKVLKELVTKHEER